MIKKSFYIFLIVFSITGYSQTKKDTTILYPSYKGLVMCGYQGWFRAEGDNTGHGWVHFGKDGKFDPEHVHIDVWPDVTEYEKTYPTGFHDADGHSAKVFSSADKSTTDLHFKWMKEYGIDGVFMQRFFGYTKTEKSRQVPDLILKNAKEASEKYGRAFSVMYDLSGLQPGKDDCETLIADWKHLIDDLHITKGTAKQTYLHHNNKPLVTIWGIGFPDRPYNIHDIKLEKLIDFLKNDPKYGGCSVMLGVPTFFRELDSDCLPDPYLHELIKSVDIVMPWMVGRFTLNLYADMQRYSSHIKKDIAWCAANGVDYVPCIYPGFSWYNLSKIEFEGRNPLNQIPRYKGNFFWQQSSMAIKEGATMLYVAMFDEIDEGTAIFKCTNRPPVDGKFIDYEGLPSDYYLKLAGEAGKMLRKEIPFSYEIPSMK